MRNKKKADNYCIIGIISFFAAIVFVSILAASTNNRLQVIAFILAAILAAAALTCIIISMRIYDGQRKG